MRALDRVYDIRKFELDQYWKKAQYFWGLIISIYSLCFLLFSKEVAADLISLKEGLLMGILFTLVIGGCCTTTTVQQCGEKSL